MVMRTLVGIFPSHAEAEAALRALHENGFSDDQFLLMSSESTSSNLAANPPKPEPRGGRGVNTGQVAGAITGFASGVLGSALVTFALPGVGPIVAVGAFALGGSLGAVAGGVVGNAVQAAYAPTLPPEDLFIYEDALRRGERVLIVQPSDEVREQIAQDIMRAPGTISTDNVWRRWWSELSQHESAAYHTVSSTPFAQIEEGYQRGFKAALDGRLRGKPPTEQDALVKEYYGEAAQTQPFQQGFARGNLYYHALLERGDPKRSETFASVS
jgi:hypothetical protein